MSNLVCIAMLHICYVIDIESPIKHIQFMIIRHTAQLAARISMVLATPCTCLSLTISTATIHDPGVNTKQYCFRILYRNLTKTNINTLGNQYEHDSS